mgnify:CR=1 FL=1
MLCSRAIDAIVNRALHDARACASRDFVFVVSFVFVALSCVASFVVSCVVLRFMLCRFVMRVSRVVTLILRASLRVILQRRNQHIAQRVMHVVRRVVVRRKRERRLYVNHHRTRVTIHERACDFVMNVAFDEHVIDRRFDRRIVDQLRVVRVVRRVRVHCFSFRRARFARCVVRREHVHTCTYHARIAFALKNF